MDIEKPKKVCNPPSWLSLPSAWDWSISFEENLGKILYNVNVIVQYLEDLQTNYEEYTDKAIDALRVELTAVIDQLRDYHDRTLAELRTYVDQQDTFYWNEHLKDVVRIEGMITDLRTYVDTNFKDIRDKHASDVVKIYADMDVMKQNLTAYVDSSIERTRAWVQEELDKLRLEVDKINEDGFRIDNPTTGLRDHVGNTVTDVWNALRVHAITAAQFDEWFEAFGNVGTDFQKLYMTAIDFDVQAYRIMYEKYKHRIYNPMTGEWGRIQTAIEDVASMDNEICLTASERDNILQFNDADYKKYNVTAYFWDRSSIQIFDTNNIQTIERSANGFKRKFKIVGTYDAPEVTEGTVPYLIKADLPVTAKRIDLINAIVAPELSNSGTYQTVSRNYLESVEHNLLEVDFNVNVLNVTTENDLHIIEAPVIMYIENVALKGGIA